MASTTTPQAASVTLSMVLLACSQVVCAQFGTQLLLDTSTTSAYVMSATAASNGDAVYLCKGHNGFSSIRRHAPDGTPVWSKDYATTGLAAGLKMLEPDLNGGFLAARQRNSYTYSSNSMDLDTSFLEIDLASIDESGAVSWVRTLRIQRIQFMSMYMNLFWITSMRLSNDEIALVASIQHSGNMATMVVIRLSADGSQVLHAKQFGHSGVQDPFLTFSTSGLSAHDAGDDGILLVTPSGNGGPIDYPYVVKFDAQGDWVWARTINYANNAPYQKSQAAAFASNGDILIYVVVSTPGGQSLIHRLNSNGILQRSDLYSDHQWSEGPISMHGLASGDHLVVKPNGRLLHLTEDGNPIAMYDHIPTALADQTYSPGLKSSMVQGNSLSLFGSFTGVHQIFGTIGSWPMFERFDLSGPIEGCNISDVPMQQYPVPANIITVADQNPPQTVDISGSLVVSTASWSATDLSGLPPLDLCVFIEELGVGVEDATSVTTAPMLRTNCVLSDGRVEALIPAAGMLEWRDSLGRLLAAQRVSVNGPTMLHAPSIAGHYLLTWTAADGSEHRSERLMVQ